VYGAASPADLAQAHDALAWVTNPALDADRRAWPSAAAGPDEEIASGLERTADQARDHGGHAAETALTARSSEFTPDPHTAPGASSRLPGPRWLPGPRYAGDLRHVPAMLDRAESALKELIEREHALPRVSSHGRRRAESARRLRRGSPRWTSRAVIPVDGVASLSDPRPGQDVPTASCARVCASTGRTRSMTCTVALGGECEGPGVVTRPLRLDRCSNPCGGTYHLVCSLVHGDYSAARSSTAVDSNVVHPRSASDSLCWRASPPRPSSRPVQPAAVRHHLVRPRASLRAGLAEPQPWRVPCRRPRPITHVMPGIWVVLVPVTPFPAAISPGELRTAERADLLAGAVESYSKRVVCHLK
jgi:hypothetical protein